MKEAREGLYSHPNNGVAHHLSDDDAAIAALVAATIEAEAAAAAGGGSHGGAAAAAAEEEPGSPSFLGALQELAAQLDVAEPSSAAQMGGEEETDEALEDPEAAAMDPDEAAAAPKAVVHAPAAGDQMRRLEDLEAEIETMLEATNAATVAVEHLSGETDQEYLSQILGLTQEAVDAMQPAMSNLPGWDSRSTRVGAVIVDVSSAPESPLPAGATSGSDDEAAEVHIPPTTSRFSTTGCETEAAAPAVEGPSSGPASPPTEATEAIAPTAALVQAAAAPEQAEEAAAEQEGNAEAACGDEASSIWGNPAVGPGAEAADADEAWDADDDAAVAPSAAAAAPADAAVAEGAPEEEESSLMHQL